MPFPTNVTEVATADYVERVNHAIEREIAAGHISAYVDRAALLEKANIKISKILSSGLKLCTRPDSELRCFLLTRYDHLTAADLSIELGTITYYISDTGYYGTDIPTALTNLAIGNCGCWVFAVYDPHACSFRADTQAMFTDFEWGEQEKLFDAFAAKYQTVGTIMSLDHASQGMLHIHDSRLPGWNNNAFGWNAHNRFIKLPTEVEIKGEQKKLFPGGGVGTVGDGQAGWYASTWGGGHGSHGVVALVG